LFFALADLVCHSPEMTTPPFYIPLRRRLGSFGFSQIGEMGPAHNIQQKPNKCQLPSDPRESIKNVMDRTPFLSFSLSVRLLTALGVFFPPFLPSTRQLTHTPGPIGRYDYERGGCGNEIFFSSSSFFLSLLASYLQSS
jgi:hypothetical protein